MAITDDYADDLRAELAALDATEYLLEWEFWAAIRRGDRAGADDYSHAITRVWCHRANIMKRACLIDAPTVSAAMH